MDKEKLQQSFPGEIIPFPGDAPCEIPSGHWYDTRPPIGAIDRLALEEEARVLAFGSVKHNEMYDWRDNLDLFSSHYNAALRHILAFIDGENNDPESGLSHLAHARCRLGFLIRLVKDYPAMDDRYREKKDE